jgi:hypothetical protein
MFGALIETIQCAATLMEVQQGDHYGDAVNPAAFTTTINDFFFFLVHFAS